MGKQTDAQPVFDFPAAWKSVEPTKTDQHHERCSYRQTDRALLCDCAAVIAAEAAWHLAHQEPAPDWADLREMARNAGWTRARGFSERGDAWLPPASDGYRQERDGWVIVEHRDRIGGRRVVTLVGTGKYPKRTACLVDPSPAEVLTAARLVGLVGAS